MIQRGQQEMARYIVEGLSQNRTQSQSNTNDNDDAGVEGDIEDGGGWDGQRTGRERRMKARKPLENILSVSCFPFVCSRCHLLTSSLGEDPGPSEGPNERPYCY